MSFINAHQLAFVLDIKVNDARAKMCVAWEKGNNLPKKAFTNEKGKVIDEYPEAMEIQLIATQCNLPDLQSAVTDIQNNFLTRPAYKKWILCDFPEKEIKKCAEAGKQPRLNIPRGLRSLLSTSSINQIKQEWSSRFPNVKV